MKSQRILTRRKELGLTQTDVARATGVTKAAVSKWEKGDTFPKGESLFSLAKILKCDVNWILKGHSTPESIPESPSNVTEISNVKSVRNVSQIEKMCAVPVYNVYASCGFGTLNDAEFQLRTEFLPCEWLKRFSLTEETARIIICHGDSMEITLSDGDEVLVDIRELEHPVKHGVYVVRIGKHVYIKRLKYDIMAEGYEVISDNKEEYDSFIVNEDKLNEFAVIGKVVTTVMKAVV
ncbi:helix-turn-helix domain-containing protein [Vibrio brasiliensis]|uniref:helix-turn-helix domain-containing protein n=1 Tax=Vibrio brasiliensis TaxID=170652 RepID=UPI001EFD450C|nr:S24 family peptidase [Vibrio brasiliensis]MCG9782664.1 helix-turn-helix domain-containing protein [Vibrio brasiliensis]